MRTLLFTCISLFSLLLCSCGPGDRYKDEVNTLDSLVVSLDKAEKLFNSIDSAGARKYYENVNAGLGHISELVKDTLSRDQAMLISQFRSVKKPLKDYLQRLSVTYEEIAVTRKQLQDLSHDISKGLMPEKDIKHHVQKETELARLLINTLNMSHESMGVCMKRYEVINPRIDSLVQVMENDMNLSTGK